MIYNIYKPIDWTSFDVVKKIKNITKENKVGHGGTLDPFAEGVLIVGTGKDTKALSSISSYKKSYTATLKLGTATDTLDVTGIITYESSIPSLSFEDIENILNKFVGKQKQIPPMYSAKKVGGKKLYELARKNIEIERDPVDIEIFEIKLNNFNKQFIEFEITCSKGTYVRVLGSDIAKALGTVGHLTKLVRNSVGDYLLDESISIKAFEKRWKNISQ
jgi:tRNA pseudouridine55 synthase